MNTPEGYTRPKSARKDQIRNAATVIVLRDRTSQPAILMGQRSASAAFMPSKFVFPGGAVDADDARVSLARAMAEPCRTRLTEATLDEAPPVSPEALAAAAIRELLEETGQMLGVPGRWPAPATGSWAALAERGLTPDPGHLQFVFRAVTPPGRTRRFDARFFLVDAAHLAGDPDDFSAASDELSHLQWIPLETARGFDMPFITEVVLAEIAARVAETAPPDNVPFFRNSDEESLFLRLGGTQSGHSTP